MGTRQVTVEYSGSTSFDIDGGSIGLGIGIFGDADPGPSDEAIERAIRRDIAAYMEHGSDVAPVDHEYRYDRDELIASVRAEIKRRKADDADGAA